ncbi:MAG: rod shape-determining protein MreD [Deltaproteobacteria bacterium]|nr:rod shape-determining protein MreD [Deltaproteobacteria bacterium]
MLRYLVMGVCAYVLVILQSTIISELFPDLIKPDLMLVVVTYWGITCPFLPGSLLTFWGGLLMDSLSGSPFGIFMVIYLGIFFFIRLLGRFLIMGKSFRFRLSLMAVALVLQMFGLSFLPWALGVADHFLLAPSIYFLTQMVMTCTVFWPLFKLQDKINLLFKEAPAQPIP